MLLSLHQYAQQFHSRYEHMVTNFSGWLHEILATLPDLAVPKWQLQHDLVHRKTSLIILLIFRQ